MLCNSYFAKLLALIFRHVFANLLIAILGMLQVIVFVVLEMTFLLCYLSVATVRGDEWSLRAFTSMFLRARAEIKNLLCEQRAV